MPLTSQQRQQTEARIRAAADQLLRGDLPPGGRCDIKTLAHAAGISRAALYRTYPHLKEDFERRLTQVPAAGRAAALGRQTASRAARGDRPPPRRPGPGRQRPGRGQAGTAAAHPRHRDLPERAPPPRRPPRQRPPERQQPGRRGQDPRRRRGARATILPCRRDRYRVGGVRAGDPPLGTGPRAPRPATRRARPRRADPAVSGVRRVDDGPFSRVRPGPQGSMFGVFAGREGNGRSP